MIIIIIMIMINCSINFMFSSNINCIVSYELSIRLSITHNCKYYY